MVYYFSLGAVGASRLNVFLWASDFGVLAELSLLIITKPVTYVASELLLYTL